MSPFMFQKRLRQAQSMGLDRLIAEGGQFFGVEELVVGGEDRSRLPNMILKRIQPLNTAVLLLQTFTDRNNPNREGQPIA